MVRADATVKAVQQTLKEQGFYHGEVTGEQNAETTAAIRRYQIRQGLQVSGELNEETTKALGLGRAAPSTPNVAVQTPAPAPPIVQQPRAQTPSVQPYQPNIAPAPQTEIEPQDQQIYDAPLTPPPPSPALKTVDVFIDTPYEMAPPQLQQQVVIGAQVALARRGLYRNAVDGVFGPGTELSLRAYQAEAGLDITGRLDMETLASLRLLPNQQHSGRRFRREVAPHFPPQPVVRGEWIH